MDEENKKRVLVCPLGWGLGHASRLIPIINQLKKKGFEVITAGDKLQMQYLLSYFPDIQAIYFPSFNVRFSKGSNQLFPILGIALRLPYHIAREHYAIKKIVKDYNIKLIISDNRYGLWHKGIKSVFITHQLRVMFPKPFRFFESLGEAIIRFFIKKYDYCWIPDYTDENNLSGKLSHSVKQTQNSKFIGLLSRFQGVKINIDENIWDLVGISSGPSPQRKIFIDLIQRFGRRNNLKTLIIKGNPDEGSNIFEEEGVHYAGHLDDNEFVKAIVSAKHLIARSGYSTIMDLEALGVSGLVVPTPGQTEQEYLAEYLSSKGLFKTCKQYELESIDLSTAQKRRATSNNLFDSRFQEIIFQQLVPLD